MKKYKVWIAIKILNEEIDGYNHLSPFSICIGSFDSLEEANQKVIDITGESILDLIIEES